jgi:hypothetical protein
MSKANPSTNAQSSTIAKSGHEQKDSTFAVHTLVNGDIKQNITGGTSSISSSTGPPVVSINSGQPFMEAPSSNAPKQNSGQDGKHLSYAQITQKKKEEREAKEAADRAAAAAAAHNLNHGPVDGASAVDPSTKKIVKDQVAVKQNLHGVNSSSKDTTDHIKSSVISPPGSGSSSLKSSNSPASDCSKVPATSSHPASVNSSSAVGSRSSKGGNSPGSFSNASVVSNSNIKSVKAPAGAANTYAKRSSSRGKSPPIVSAAVLNVAPNPTTNANTNINTPSSTTVTQSSPSSKAASANSSGAVQTNSTTTSVVSAAQAK